MRLTEEVILFIMFGLFGAVAIVLGFSYGIGSPARAGAGLVPFVVGVALSCLSANFGFRAIRETSNAISFPELRPLLYVVGSILLFAILIERAGLIISVVSLVIFSRLADRNHSSLDLIVTTLVLIALSVGIFVHILGLNIALWWF